MMYVTLCNDRAGTTRDRTARRLHWTPPDGVKVIGEYWLQTPNPRVIFISEVESIEPLFAALTEWDDVFEMTVVPACTGEEGMRLAQQSMLVTASH